jgi:hypothetical protein
VGKHFLILVLAKWVVLLIISLAIAEDSVPQPKRVELGGRSVSVGTATELNIDIPLRNRFRSSIDVFGRKLASFLIGESNLPIGVEVLDERDESSLPPDILQALKLRESYWIAITANGIRIRGADELGVLHGLTTLEGLVVQGSGRIQQGQIIDWPDHEIRGLHFVQRSIDPHLVKKQIIDPGRYGHFNTLILSLADGILIPSMRGIASDKAWTREELSDVVKYAKENGLEVVPEIRLLTHQEKLLKNAYPELMFNRSTYDPRKEETYAVVLPIIDEIINLIQPRAVHIGHDEVAGYDERSRKKWLREGEEILPPELFLRDVERIHEHLNSRGVETWMWGDMLIAPEEIPRLKRLHGSHGYSALRTRIPKDIVICDWHYHKRASEFPSALIFIRQGHLVLGATYEHDDNIRNFSRYMAKLPKGSIGMIATTWGRVSKMEWDVVNNIIKTSAEAFWNAN